MNTPADIALPDVRTWNTPARLAAASAVRAAPDFALPALDYFNSQPCPAHTGGPPQVSCRHCGVRLRRHQRVGVAWLYLRERGLIADQVGTGKTPQAAGLLACLKQAGELDTGRAVIAVRPSVLPQWMAQLRRLLPKLVVVSAAGGPRARAATYLNPGWEVLVTGFQVLVRDAQHLEKLPLTVLIADDIDALRNPTNATACALKRLARHATRCVVLTATPLQKRLPELHSVLEMVGGLEVFGPASTFRRRYLREDLVRLYSPKAGRMVTTRQLVGYQNLDEFKTKAAPLTLRRTPADIDDVDLPALAPPNNVYLELYPAQRARYEQLRTGVLQIIKTEGTQVKQAKAAAAFLYGAQICAGLGTLGEPDGPGGSVKLDWVLRVLSEDLAEEKVVIFAQFTNTVAALAGRLHQAHIGHAVIWGRQRDPAAREHATARFWNDPTCRVLIGTSAIEQGLDLQIARHLICVDQIMNPARMQQLAGRIRRDGTAYRTVYVHNLLARDTQEEGYLDLLGREQALADHVWDETNILYKALPALVLLALIGDKRR